MLAGYPATGVEQSRVGKLHATASGNDNYELFGESVYVSTDVNGDPGMSGAPVLVKHPNGNYYPAGIYLGGNQRSVVRAIDDRVVDLIKRAESTANGGGNHGGSGARFVAAGLFASDDPLEPAVAEQTGSIGEFGTVRVDIGGTGLAQWFVEDEFGDRVTGILEAEEEPELAPGEYVVRFVEVGGYETPRPRTITVSAGQVASPEVRYSRAGGESWKSDPNGDEDGDGVSNLLEYAFPEQGTGGASVAYAPEVSVPSEGVGRCR